jgi:hypothetical protein
MQAPFEHDSVFAAHATAALQAPLAEHVWTPFPVHCVAAGAHTPVQTPATQADATHGDSTPHWPFAPQVWTPLFEHCFAPGVHRPVHEPETHAWFAQIAPSFHVPVESQV